MEKEQLQWVILGDELKAQGVSYFQVKEWCRVILALGLDKKTDAH